MWNLISQGTQAATYRPSATTGTITNPTFAYDLEFYPWATKATTSKVGSSVAGTPDTTSYVFHTFPTLAKSAFSLAILRTAIDVSSTTPYVTGSYGISAAVGIYYSVDGGASWLQCGGYNTSVTNGVIETMRDDAYDVSLSAGFYMVPPSASRSEITASLPSSVFATGLQDLQLKFEVKTLKSSRSGNPASSVSLGIWDIIAEVS